MATSATTATDAPRITTGPIGSLFSSDRARAVITPLLRGDSYEAVVSEIHILARRKPDILKCTGESIVMAVADGLRWGLIFGETVHMVPFNEKVKYLDEEGRQQEKKEWRAHAIIGWKGAIEMVIRSGSARDIDAQCVYRNELREDDPTRCFFVRQGTSPDVQHFPILDDTKRGELVGAYCIARITQYHKKVVWMSAAEINAIRHEHSKQHKDGPLKPWYARKTLVLQMGNRLPRNIKLDKALTAMRAEQEIEDVETVEIEVTDTRPASAPAQQSAQRALTEGPAREIDISHLREEAPVRRRLSDDELDDMRFAGGFNGNDDDPRDVSEIGHRPGF